MKISAALIVATVAVALAGCGALPPSPGATQNPAQTTSPTEPAEQERETGLVPPAQVFGGSCDALVTTDELTQISGMPMQFVEPSAFGGVPYPYVPQHGGIECTWTTVGDSQSGVVTFIALPAEAVEYSASTACDVFTDSDEPGCALEAVQNGIRISGAVFQYGSDPSAQQQTQKAILDLFAQRATVEAAAPVPLPAQGAWAWPVNCAAVVDAGDFSAVPGLGAAATGEQSGGSDAYYPAAEVALWGGFSPPYCNVYSGDVYVTFYALGGGRWAEASVTAVPGATSVPVEGIDVVVQSPGYSGLTRVDVFDGPNWLTFWVRYPANAGVAAQALVSALDTTALE